MEPFKAYKHIMIFDIIQTVLLALTLSLLFLLDRSKIVFLIVALHMPVIFFFYSMIVFCIKEDLLRRSTFKRVNDCYSVFRRFYYVSVSFIIVGIWIVLALFIRASSSNKSSLKSALLVIMVILAVLCIFFFI
jgi:hypothetical protein